MNVSAAPQVSVADMIQVAKEGSPLLINAVSRLAGLGAAEQNALANKGVPGWAWAALAGTVGVIVGIRWYRARPEQVPAWIVGK